MALTPHDGSELGTGPSGWLGPGHRKHVSAKQRKCKERWRSEAKAAIEVHFSECYATVLAN
jgi:hypothetical protein